MATDWYLVITEVNFGGTVDTVTFADGSGGATDYKFADDSWSPAVAGVRHSELGGLGAYEDVVEEMEIIVKGATNAAAMANMATLARLLDKAERWARGDYPAAVSIKFSPKGGTVSSAANPLTAVILGRAGGDQTALNLPVNFDQLTFNAYIVRARLRFVRRGEWLHTADTIQVTNITNGDLATFTMTEARDVPAPTLLQVETNFGYGKSTGTRWIGGYVLLGEDHSNDGIATVAPIVILPAEAGTATGYTSVTDAGQNPRNTNILRYTPTGTTEVFSGSLGTPTFPGFTTMVALFANVRPSATVDFRLKARVNSNLLNRETPYVAIAAMANPYPRWVFLGLAPVFSAIASLYLAVTASAASSSLDIDTVVVCDARTTHVLAVLGPGDTEVNSAAVVGSLTISHLRDSQPVPSVGAVNQAVPYGGDAVMPTQAATLYALVLATGGGTGATGNEWRQVSSSSDTTVLASTISVVRTRAYITPQ